MENQHRKIKGYRELSQEEIDLMNEIKAHGEKTKELLIAVKSLGPLVGSCEIGDISVENTIERERCLRIATDYLQTGQMWFVRAVALPESF